MNNRNTIHYVFFSSVCVLLVSIFVFVIVRFTLLENSMRDYVAKTVAQSEEHLQKVMESSIDEAKIALEKRLNEKTESVQNHIETELKTALKKDFRNTRHTIQGLQTKVIEQSKKTDTIETTFTALLDEQKKQHISTVVADTVLAKKEEQAKRLFEEQEYIQAANLWDEIVAVQSDNFDARFYAQYARYLYNPMDSSLYTKIVQEFTLLQKNGYMRQEMDDVLQTLRMETTGGTE